MNRLEPQEIARRRVIERLDLAKGKGVIVCFGRTFTIVYDDLLDLAQAVEMIMVKLTGKVLNAKFRPVIRDRKALAPTRVVGGDYTLYDGSQGPAPLSGFIDCEITQRAVKVHYLLVEIAGARWDNWFGRLDELVKCLYIVVREAQGDPYVTRPMIFVSREAQDNVVSMRHSVEQAEIDAKKLSGLEMLLLSVTALSAAKEIKHE